MHVCMRTWWALKGMYACVYENVVGSNKNCVGSKRCETVVGSNKNVVGSTWCVYIHVHVYIYMF